MPAIAKRISTQIISSVFVKKAVVMWFVPRRFENQVEPGMKVVFWNSGEYYGRIRRLQETTS
ncbi:hypothetical protein ACJ8PP_06010 [Serratia sp. CY82423]|uniref:hypothetical protein n=1 Tax=Serratia TaxID=613 RepID=UPI00313EA6D2